MSINEEINEPLTRVHQQIDRFSLVIFLLLLLSAIMVVILLFNPSIVINLLPFLLLMIAVLAMLFHFNRRANARQLQSVVAQNSNLLDHIELPVIMLYFDSEGQVGSILRANNAAVELFGYSDTELLKKNFSALMPPARKLDIQLLVESLNSQGVARQESLLRKKDGTNLPVMLAARLLENLLTPTLLLVINDLSDQKAVESRLREARGEYRVLNNAVEQGVVRLDITNNISGWNSAAEKMLGWQEYEVFGAAAPFIPSDWQSGFAGLCAKAADGEVVSRQRQPLLRNDGKEIFADISAVPLRDALDNYCGLLLLLIDVTNPYQCENQLALLQRKTGLLDAVKLAVNSSNDEEIMLTQSCRQILQHSGYCHVWIGMLDESGDTVLRPVAWSNENNNEIAQASLPINDARRLDPIVCSLQQNSAQQIPNLANIANTSELYRALLRHGVGAAMVLPLFGVWKAVGVLVVGTMLPQKFNSNEITLFSEVADEVATALDALRARKHNEKLLHELSQAQLSWHATFDSLDEALHVIDNNGQVKLANGPAELLGFKGPELLQMLLPAVSEADAVAEITGNLVANNRMKTTIEIGGQWYAINCSSIIEADGESRGVLHRMRNITTYRETEEQFQRSFLRLQNILNDTITTIAKIAEMRDPYTAGHEQRVSHLACAIAKKLAMDEDRIEGIRVAGMLHDIGKLFVPAEILSKPGRLSAGEFNIIKSHPETGNEILKTIDFPWPIAQIVRQHHERLDGSGYPDKLQGDELLLESRILSVADVVEAMASHRPYRPALGLQLALQEISDHAGEYFDAEVVTACVSVFQEDGYQMMVPGR